MKLCIQENYSKRELERQLSSGYYERYLLSMGKAHPEGIKSTGNNPFMDSYVIEFLDLGKDFTFIDDEYKVQVGGDDYSIDFLFFHRGLQCLVAFELKIGRFKPEYVSKMDFYLEALDRQTKKEHENPSVGLILCASKNDEVVEYAMSRSMSPMLVSEYKWKLQNKEVLRDKLQELANVSDIDSE